MKISGSDPGAKNSPAGKKEEDILKKRNADSAKNERANIQYQKKQREKRKSLQELNLTSRFLYDEVMEDPEAHRAALSIVFGREISLLTQNESEKEERISPLARSVRMDIMSMDSEGVVYDSEMQAVRKSDLKKRSRYNQSLMDTNLLEPGVPNYNLLNDTYIILITTFDMFGCQRYQYTFVAECLEVPGLWLDDGATRIFLNTRGKNDDEVPKELVDFLHYLEDTTDERAEASGSKHIRKIHERVRKVKQSEEVGVKYMRAWEEKYYEHEEGCEEGFRKRLILQVQKKVAKGKSLEVSADELELEIDELSEIYSAVIENKDMDVDEIFYFLKRKEEE